MSYPAALVAEFLHALSARERRHDHPDTLERFKLAYQRLAHFSPLPPGEGPGVREEPPLFLVNNKQAGSIVAREGAPSLTPGPSPGGRGEIDQCLHKLTAGFAHAESNWVFGTIATVCGVLVERGGDPTIALEPILDRITTQLARVSEFVSVMQQHLGVEHPNQVAPGDWPALGQAHPEQAWVIGEWFALNFVGGAAMTMLCRDVNARQRSRQRIELVHAAESARSDQPYAYYLAELLAMVDEERLLVLNTVRKVGYRVRLTAVRNNFHLFTLLQDALIPHDPRLNGLAISIAKSERMLPSVSPSEWSEFGEHDAALRSFNTWMAMKADGAVQTLEESQERPHWIWGEMKPTEIPMFDGERIVLLGPLDSPRSWEVAFFVPLHSALRSSVRVEETFSGAAYDGWIEQIRERAKI